MAGSPRSPTRRCIEDLDAASTGEVTGVWAKITMPAVLLRATVPFGGDGLVVSEADAVALQRTAPGLRVLDVDRNHFGIMTDDGMVAATRELLAKG
jgi:hypothetical protein